MQITTTVFTALVAAVQIYTSVAQALDPRPSEAAVFDTPTSQGCYQSKANMTSIRLSQPNSSANCIAACKDKKYPVLAMQGGNCFCGFAMPSSDDVVKDGNCDTGCPYYNKEPCGGGTKYYSIYNTGVSVDVEEYDPEKSSSSSSSTKTSSTSVSPDGSSATETSAVVVTETSSQSATPSSSGDKSHTNTAGIAAGVVVGVVAIAAAIGGLVFFMRRKRNAEIEEEHRRNAAVNAFISGSKPPSSHGSISMTDSRLDPVMAHRRMSDGSIADNEDYSRRILRVTNA